jgi:hypothetical protein
MKQNTTTSRQDALIWWNELFADGVSDDDKENIYITLQEFNNCIKLKSENEQLKASNKELVEALESSLLVLEPLARNVPDGWDKDACKEIFKTVKSALKKAKANG